MAMSEPNRPTAVITGASSGIGAAAASVLVRDGFDVVLGARRRERVDRLAKELGEPARGHVLDVTDEESVRAFADAVPSCAALICSAGGALGLDSIADADDERWRWMWETNVLGVVRTVRAFLPKLVDSGDGRVVVITSLAAHEAYPNGGGYSAAKHAASALTTTLRMELLGKPVRVTELAPGMVDTEFSLVRFEGDPERSAAPYRGMRPLSADDVAEAIAWSITRPAHVNVARLDLYPTDQAAATAVHRRDPE